MAEEEVKLVEDDFEQQSNDPVVSEGELAEALAEADDPTIEVTGFPYAKEEEVGLPMEPVEIVGPPAYGSPDPTTAASRLVPLRDHPLTEENVGEDSPSKISADYGADLEGSAATFGTEGSHHGAPEGTPAAAAEAEEGETDYNSMTVAQLKEQAAARQIEGASSMNKADLVSALEDADSEES